LWLTVFPVVFGLFLCWRQFCARFFFSFFDSVILLSTDFLTVLFVIPSTDYYGHVVNFARVWAGLKGISRVMSLFESFALEIRIRLKGLEIIIKPIYKTLPTLAICFRDPYSFDGPSHLFDTFWTVLRMALSHLFFFFFSFVFQTRKIYI
jgi:hypothetical protein